MALTFTCYRFGLRAALLVLLQRINGMEFVDSAIVGQSAMYVGTVEIACRIRHQPVVHKRSVGRTPETIGHALHPVPIRARRELEDNAATASGTAFAGGAVQVTCVISNQVAERAATVRSTLKAVKHPFRPNSVIRTNFVNRAQTILAVVIRRAVKVLLRVEHQTAIWESRIRLTFEGI